MVRGLDLFRDYFKDYTDKYILIGGTACDLAMENMGLNFRATKDLEMPFGILLKKATIKTDKKVPVRSCFIVFTIPRRKHFLI